jgi:predicted porin
MVEDNATVQREGTLMAVGIDHKFDKKTSGYVMYSNLEEELGSTTDVDNTFLGAGLVLKF